MAANDIIVPRENAQGQFEELVLPDATTSARGLLSASDKTKLDSVASGAEVNVNADWNASSGDAQILNKPSTFTPTAHAASHASAGSDPLAPSDIGAQSIFDASSISTSVSGVPLQLTAARARTWSLENPHSNRDVYLPVTGIQTGDVAVLVGGGTMTYTLTVKVPAAGGAAIIDPENTPSGSPVVISATGQQYRFIVTNPANFNPWRFVAVDSHTHAASAITSGTLDIARIPTGTSGTTVALGNHTHTPSEVGLGNVSNTAQVTSVSGTAPIVSSGGTTPTISVTTGSTAGTVCAGDDARLSDARTPTSHTHGNITNGGLVGTTSGLPLKTGTGGIVEAGAFGTSAGQFAEGNHAHGNLTSSGTIGSTAGLPVVTTTAGAVTTLALGTAGQILRTKSDLSGVEFADPAASGVTGAASSASDVLGVSGSDITGVDATADRIVFWDDSASALKYLEAGSGLSISGTTMTVTATGGATNLWIPASAWIPRTTGGCGVDSREIGATNRANVDELLFDTGTEEFAQALVVMPSNYNNGTITARFYWTAASGSGGVAWGISGRAYGDDDALDQATGTRIVVTDTFIAANDVHVTSATSAVTIDGTPAANKAINFQISREVGNASDTLGVDARLLGVEIIFN